MHWEHKLLQQWRPRQLWLPLVASRDNVLLCPLLPWTYHQWYERFCLSQIDEWRWGLQWCHQCGVLASLQVSWISLGNGTLLVDTPLCKSSALADSGTSGRASGVSPVQGGISPHPWVLSSIDALSAIFISVTLLCSRQNSVEDIKKRETVLLSVPHFKALLLLSSRPQFCDLLDYRKSQTQRRVNAFIMPGLSLYPTQCHERTRLTVTDEAKG